MMANGKCWHCESAEHDTGECPTRYKGEAKGAMMKLYEVLKTLLALDLPSPEIVLEDDGDLCIEWGGDASISVTPDGSHVNWAFYDGPHGADLEQFCMEVQKRAGGR